MQGGLISMKYELSDWFDTEQYVLKSFEIIDLSYPITEHAEVPGESGYSDPDIAFELFDIMPWVTLDIKPYYITKIAMGAHVGTHIDAPMHVKESGKSVDKIPHEFIGPAVIIDVCSELDDEMLQKKLNTLNENNILVIRGGSDCKISNDLRMQIIRYEPKVVVFGDCVNVDGVEDTIQYLENDIPMVMGAKEDELRKLEDGDIVFVLPIKFVGIEAAPVRLFAIKLELDMISGTNDDIDNLFIF